MIGMKLLIFFILVKLAHPTSNSSDGFCSFKENYTEIVTVNKTVKHRVPFSKKCGFFKNKVCYEYRDVTQYEPVAENVLRTRIVKRCCQGYASENKNCTPICSDPCLNGLCSEPEICTCSIGYHKNDKDICVENECDPTISESDKCANGRCAENGVCLCNEGYEKSNTHDVESTVESKCVPICSNGCLNGNCASPETCTCNSGFEAYNTSVCNPSCPNDCIFGTCTEPDKCTCFNGYEFRNESDHICDPVCKVDCLNGKCEEPDICLCFIGFNFSNESQICEPVCDKECINSNCTAPNICTCEPGFLPLNSTHCEILCENCMNGYCEDPNVCLCDIGYHMNIANNTCIEDECTNDTMENSCQNGYCSDGVCECDIGYEKMAAKACSPICSLECVNGFCSEPDVCQCHSGYEFIATNVTEDDENCINCTSISQWNVCKCLDCENEISDAITLTMSLFGFVIIIFFVGVFAYWRYAMWSRKSYTCAVADVVYQKSKDGISL